MVLLIFQFPGVPIINLHFPPEQIPVRMQTAFTKIRVDIQEDRVSSKLSFTDLDLETHGCCVKRIVKLHVVPHHTPPILVRLGNTQDLRDWMQRSIMQDVGWASHERVFWNLMWQWGSFDASDSRLKQEGRSAWPNWCSNMFEYIEWLSMIKFDHLLLYIFHVWSYFAIFCSNPCILIFWYTVRVSPFVQSCTVASSLKNDRSWNCEGSKVEVRKRMSNILHVVKAIPRSTCPTNVPRQT